jgi:Uma2 family endonuclease
VKPATLVPVSEYLSTCHRPDCDYLEGVLLERHVGEYDHAEVQTALAAYLRDRRKDLGIRVVGEQRVQVTAERFRVPDVCVISRESPREQIITHPPQLCVEVLSKRDGMAEMQDRIDGYLDFGVPCVWSIDPKSRKARIHTKERSYEPKDGILRVEGTAIAVPLADLFED